LCSCQFQSGEGDRSSLPQRKSCGIFLQISFIIVSNTYTSVGRLA
jgi:hypothetical protein